MKKEWFVSDAWEDRPQDRGLGKDRNIFVLDKDLSVASVCHVACIPADTEPEVHERALRDARLIAAAPGMLVRLEQALPYLMHPDVQALGFCKPAEMMAQQIQEIIATAKGGA